jgi:hypothetical protein
VNHNIIQCFDFTGCDEKDVKTIMNYGKLMGLQRSPFDAVRREETAVRGQMTVS